MMTMLTGGILSSDRSNLERFIRRLEQSQHPLVPRLLRRNAAHLAAPLYRSYTTKLRYKMAHHRDPNLVTYNDKLLARDFVTARAGAEVLPQLFFSGSEFQPGWLHELPGQFVIKTNHSSGALIVVSPRAPIDAALPESVPEGDWSSFYIRPEQADPARILAITNRWLGQNFAHRDGLPFLWSYESIAPRVYVEELLRDESGEVPADIKLWMFEGKCELIMLVTNRMTGSRVAFFDGGWNRLNVSVATERSWPSEHFIAPPKDAAGVVRLAEQISEGMDATRIDLYETAAGLKFGEITNYPMSAILDFTPRSFERKLGRRWRPLYAGARGRAAPKRSAADPTGHPTT